MRWTRERRESREPFFTYLALNAPHGPLFVPAEYASATVICRTGSPGTTG
jgi:hypothetical protein